LANVPCGLCLRPLHTHKSSVSRISEINALKYSTAAQNSPKISFKVTENGKCVDKQHHIKQITISVPGAYIPGMRKRP
jgi:hypothetical protein